MTRLIAVTLLLAVLAIVLKVRMRGISPSRAIKVTSRMSVGRNAMIAVVEVEGQRLLIGTGGSQVTLLGVLPQSSPNLALTRGENIPVTERPELAIPLSSMQDVSPVQHGAPSAGRSSSLIERARRMTTRSAQVQLRMPTRPAVRR